jgi:IS4 transposase
MPPIVDDAQDITPAQIRLPEFIRRAGRLFARLEDVGCERDKAGHRKLFYNDYCNLILLYACNPMIGGLRALQQVSGLERVQELLGLKRFSLGSFSEAPAVFDPDQLLPIMGQLAAEARPKATDPRLQELKYAVHLVDSTLLRTLPRLTETFYTSRRDGQDHHAWRVHMELELGMPAPARCQRTGARGDERKNLAAHLQPGICYVDDRGYHDVGLFNQIHAAGSRYVCRAKDGLVHTVLRDLPLTQADRDAGVISDQIVQIGADRDEPPSHPVRLIQTRAEVHPKRLRKQTRKGPGKAVAEVVPSSGRVLLLTNLTPEEAPAAVCSVLYAYRWTIELFFRFLKQMLGLRHLLSHRPAGVDIILNCMVIACLLLHMWTGVTPDKRTVEMIAWYMLGVASLAELTAHLEKRRQKEAAKKAV